MTRFLVLLALLGVSTAAAAQPAWDFRRDARPVLAYRDSTDPRVDDLLRFVCLVGGDVRGEVPARRIADQGSPANVRLKAGAAEVIAPARRSEGGPRGPTVRFPVTEPDPILDALVAGGDLRLSIVRTTYVLAARGAGEAVEAFRRACRRG